MTRSIYVLIFSWWALPSVWAVDDDCTRRNSYEWAQCQEARLFTQQPSVAVRKGGVVEVKLQRGEKTLITDFDPEEVVEQYKTKLYSIIDNYPNIGYALIHEQHYEGETYQLLSLTTGVRTDVKGIPIISPNEKRLVTSVFGGIAGYSESTIRIYLLNAVGLTLEWEITPRDWEPSDLRWTSDIKIEFTKNFFRQDLLLKYQNEKMAYVEQKGEIELQGDAWKLK